LFTKHEPELSSQQVTDFSHEKTYQNLGEINLLTTVLGLPLDCHAKRTHVDAVVVDFILEMNQQDFYQPFTFKLAALLFLRSFDNGFVATQANFPSNTRSVRISSLMDNWLLVSEPVVPNTAVISVPTKNKAPFLSQ
jgi:hypothetical protein